MKSDAGSQGEWRDAAALAALGLGINLVHIGTRSLVFDEATSVLYARMSLRSLLSVLIGEDPNQSLYYLLLHYWVRMAGESETALRCLSALAAALAVGTVCAIGARLFSRLSGLVAGLLLAVNAFIVQYAQTARGYALLLLLTALSSYFFVVELEVSSRRTRIAYVVVSVLALYTHYFAVYVLAVHALTVLAIERRNALRRAWMTVAAAVLLLTLPEVIFASRVGPAKIISWIDRPSAADVWPVFVDLAGGSAPLLLMIAIGAGWALVSAYQRPRFWPYGFVVASFIIPIALAFLASFAQPMFMAYYLICSVPGLMLSAAAAVNVCRPVVAAGLVALLLCFSIPQLAAFNPPERAENWRDATAYILDSAQGRDGLAFYPAGARKPFEYYERQRGVPGSAGPVRPPSADDGRVWLLIRESDASNRPAEVAQARSALTEHYRLVDRTQFRRLSVELYAR